MRWVVLEHTLYRPDLCPGNDFDILKWYRLYKYSIIILFVLVCEYSVQLFVEKLLPRDYNER